MAQIDVTDLYHDPDFMDEIEIISRRPIVNLYGENDTQDVCRKSIGCVQPATGKAIQRLPEALRVANVSSFWINGPIEASREPGKYTDILVFRGRRYQVQIVFDWTNWGAGWSEGTCVGEAAA
jgi:hypothetical protein